MGLATLAASASRAGAGATHTWWRPHGRLAVGLAAVVTIVRWLAVRERSVPQLLPDEAGQLAMARFLGGDTVWRMFDHSTWRPGWALLVSPIHWVADDPVTVFRSILAMNAVLGGIAAALLYALAVRLTDLPASRCAVATLLTVMAPSLLLPSGWVWAESLVVVLFLATVWLLLRAVDRPTTARWSLAVLAAAAAFSTHGRMLPLMVVVVAAAIVTGRSALGRIRTTALMVGAIALTWASDRGAAAVIDRVWTDPAQTNSISGVVAQIWKPWSIAIAAAGQLWYLLVATIGLAGLGAWVLVRAATTAVPPRSPGRTDARLVLAMMVPTIALSMVFMADRSRADQVVYGRYNDALIAPLVMLGIATLLRPAPVGTGVHLVRWAASVCTAIAVTAAAVLTWRADQLERGVVPAMVLGLVPFDGDTVGVAVIAVSVVAGGLVVTVAMAAIVDRRRGAATPVVTIALLSMLVALGSIRSHRAFDHEVNAWAPIGAVATVSGSIVPPGTPLQFREVLPSERPTASWASQQHRRMLYQYYLPQHPMSLWERTDAGGRPAFVFAPVRDQVMLAAGGEIVWRDLTSRMALWRLP